MGILQEKLINTLTLLTQEYPEVERQLALAKKYTYPDKNPKTLIIALSILHQAIAKTPAILNSPHIEELSLFTRLHSKNIALIGEPVNKPSKSRSKR